MHHQKRSTTRPANRSNRRGTILIVAMVCLLLVSAVGVSLLRLASTAHRQSHREAYRLQAAWLAEAGLERAAAKLASDGEYRGETWDLSAADLDGRRAGRVMIEIEPNPQAPGKHQVAVVADFPHGNNQRARVSKQIAVRINIETE